ncbi:MAG TPA: F0F1 ATP synthase subunit B [Gaiellaceae bacterium]|nr:F0F1 ATP synthase subunit B [Gaiellaceae bacterium]
MRRASARISPASLFACPISERCSSSSSLIGQAKSEAGEILAEARRTADAQRERVKEEAEEDRQRRLEDTRRQIEAETTRALEQIRAEVADLTVVAASKVTGKVLDREDHRRLIEDAIGELDFSALERQSS